MRNDYFLFNPEKNITNSKILDDLSLNIKNCSKKEMIFDKEFSPVYI
jgi:hypothetical protein